MSAYELADLIDSEDTLWLESRLKDICNMLRYQADCIKHLEDGLESSIKLNKAQADEISALKKELYFKDYYEELPDTPVDLLRKAQDK